MTKLWNDETFGPRVFFFVFFLKSHINSEVHCCFYWSSHKTATLLFSSFFSTLKYDFFSPLTACFLLRLHLSTFIFYYAHTERRKSDGDEGKHWTEGGKQTDRVDRQIARAVCVKLILTCPNSLPSSSPSLCLSYKLLSVCLFRLKRCCWDRLLAIRAFTNLSFIEIVLIPNAKQGSHNAWWKNEEVLS